MTRRTPSENQPALTDDERALLRAGLGQWGGPADLSPALAGALSCADTEDLRNRLSELTSGIDSGGLSPVEWRRALLATEIVFASDVIGAGLDWETATGLGDVQTLGTLRALQRKLGDVVHTA